MLRKQYGADRTPLLLTFSPATLCYIYPAFLAFFLRSPFHAVVCIQPAIQHPAWWLLRWAMIRVLFPFIHPLYDADHCKHPHTTNTQETTSNTVALLNYNYSVNQLNSHLSLCSTSRDHSSLPILTNPLLIHLPRSAATVTCLV